MSNHLQNETSLHLKQHADDPIHWYPWSTEAFDKAKQENKPIFLSIGYAACHWCRQMGRETFQCSDAAELLNRHFVSIKVDREERPELDKIYQHAHLLLNKAPGGWPLSVFLDPADQAPFFCGTYFPADEQSDKPDFVAVLQKIQSVFSEHYDVISEQNKTLIKALNASRKTPDDATDSTPISTKLDQAFDILSQAFDPVSGGFGNAPKFARLNEQNLMMSYAYNKRYDALTSADFSDDDVKKQQQSLKRQQTFTLQQIIQSGLYDHVDGGFFRYSTDANFQIPNFEKILFDNAQHVITLANYVTAERHSQSARVMSDTVKWLVQTLRHESGGFLSGMHASSGDNEGGFYLFNAERVKQALKNLPDVAGVLLPYFGFNQPANFNGKWHLSATCELSKLAKNQNLPLKYAHVHLDNGLEVLKNMRSERIPPKVDNKIITGWNGLTIKALALAGNAVNKPEWIQIGHETVDFLRENLWKNNRLYANRADGKTKALAYLDDYALLIDGLQTLLQISWRDEDFEWCETLIQQAIELFYDADQGGFFYTANDHERLIHRPKVFLDESIPSGNAVMMMALISQANLLGHSEYESIIQKTAKLGEQHFGNIPHAHSSFLRGLIMHHQSQDVVIIRGEEYLLAPWLQAVRRDFVPERVVYAIPTSSKLNDRFKHAAPHEHKVSAYICTRGCCLAPIESISAFESVLKARHTY